MTDSTASRKTTCSCHRTAPGAFEVIPFGADLHLRTLKKRGAPKWWVRSAVCDHCGQHWLIAQDERINDLYLLRKMTDAEVTSLDRDDVWPTTFDRYDDLLRIEQAAGHAWNAWDRGGTAALATAHVLRQERPDIGVDEIVELLRLDADEGRRIAASFDGMAS